MKVLLVQPPIEDYYTTAIRSYPLGLLFIASKISDICNVEIVDFRQSKKARKTNSIFPELSEIYNDRISPFSLFSKYSRYGLSPDEIKEIIRNKKPDIIGISSLFSTYFEEAIEVAKIAKEVNEKIITVLGGNHPTLFPEKVLSYDYVDFVIRGEGEIPFRLLIKNYGDASNYQNIEGLCYKKNGRLIISNIFRDSSIELNLNREMLPKENYRYGKGFIAPVITSRGCPHCCDFCGKPQVKFRFYNEEDVKRDIDKLINLGFDTIDIEDDFFDITMPRNKEMLKWLRNKNIRITAMNGVVPKIDETSKTILNESGFQRINLSLVDMSDNLKDAINRGHFKEFDKILNKFIDIGIPIEVHFIIGLPDQSKADLIDTILYLSEKKVLLGPSVYYLSPGSKLYQQYSEENKNINLRYARSSALFQVNNVFDSIAIATYMRLTRFVNYIKSLVDKYGKDLHIKELLKSDSIKKEIERMVLIALVERKTFVSFDKKHNTFYEDLSKKDIIENFLSHIRFIRGYKSENICNFQ